MTSSLKLSVLLALAVRCLAVKRFSLVLLVLLGLATRSLCAWVPTDGLVAYYPLDGNANDVTGNGHDGIAYNATPTQDRFGVADSAYRFNGINRGDRSHRIDRNNRPNRPHRCHRRFWSDRSNGIDRNNRPNRPHWCNGYVRAYRIYRYHWRYG